MKFADVSGTSFVFLHLFSFDVQDTSVKLDVLTEENASDLLL